MVRLGSRPIGVAEAVLGEINVLRPQQGRVKAGSSSSPKRGFSFSTRASQMWRFSLGSSAAVLKKIGKGGTANAKELAAQMDYYIAPEEPETDFLRITRPEDIRICDPAAGSGHMLTYAFDLLHAIYEEEGFEPDLMTIAKGIAGGMPISAVTGRAEIMDASHPGGLGGTFGGNPVAAALRALAQGRGTNPDRGNGSF